MEEDAERSKKSSDDLLREAKERFGAYDPSYDVPSSMPVDPPEAREPRAKPSGEPRRREPIIPPYDPRPRRVEQHDEPALRLGKDQDLTYAGPVQSPRKSIGAGGCLGIVFLLGATLSWLAIVAPLLAGEDDAGDLILGMVILTLLPLVFGALLLRRGLRRRRES